MTSPALYILVALTLMSAMISLTSLFAWRTLGEKPHALSWSLAALAATFQWGLTLLAQAFPSGQTYWLTINALSLAVIALGLVGHCQRSGKAVIEKNAWASAIAVYLIIVWTTIVNPHAGISSAAAPAFAAVTHCLASYIVMQHRKNSRPADIATAVTTAFVGLAQGAAAVVAFMQGPLANPELQSIYDQITFMTLPAGYTGMAIFLLFVLASDLSEELRELAISDQLTGLLNRRGFSEQAAMAYATSRRTDRPISVVVTDIDRFKQINDEFGHSGGDEALFAFAELLKLGRREEDITARIGGEEFALILPGVGLVDAMEIAGGLRSLIQASPIEFDGCQRTMTASFGVATLSRKDTCMSDAIVRVDRALYKSKRDGRNRIDLESSQMLLAADGTLAPISV